MGSGFSSSASERILKWKTKVDRATKCAELYRSISCQREPKLTPSHMSLMDFPTARGLLLEKGVTNRT
ncbi:unnamed protein product [Linum trigynum]|uniref:Uncharacterized protein n=1 Tax=Linum trigynum TaxID=586398 RepID=A0AAV2GR18_9ROSI